MNQSEPVCSGVNRRDFLRNSSFASVMAMLGGVELVADSTARAADLDKLVGYTVDCGIIGLGLWGREILATLALVKEAKITGLCDSYGPMLRRSARDYPTAKAYEDYHALLANPEIKAVFIATPTHQHRTIVEEALAAGKNVYCEVPLAHTVEDARTIVQAAKEHPRLVLQPGLQLRADKHRHFLLSFIRSGAIGHNIKARAQWHKKQSWRFASPNPDRERLLNWRLDPALSLGLAGEIGIHQIDLVSWFLRADPKSVFGRGSLMYWKDGRAIADNVFALFEYDGGVFSTFEATLGNSFDSDYEMFYGSDAAVMLRGDKAWMFKEADAQLLGWEVYAKKDQFYRETGIALTADASKSVKQVEKPPEELAHVGTPLAYALDNFLYNVNETSTGVEDFEANFNARDTAALVKHLASLKLLPAATLKDGYDATIVAIKVNEAVVHGRKFNFEKKWFDVG